MTPLQDDEPAGANSTLPTTLETRNEGDRLRPPNEISPQQPATWRTGSVVSTESSEGAASKPAGQELQAIRESSPRRPQFTASARGTARSRTNSQDLSPTRNAITTFSNPVPSAAAVQRALSANKPPPQTSGVDFGFESRNAKSADSTPRWPISPRLTSPPPASARNPMQSNRKHDSDGTAPNSSVKRAAASMPDLAMTATKSMAEKEEDAILRTGLKTPARGASAVTQILETVAENSIPDTPAVIPPSERSTVSSPRDSVAPQSAELPPVGHTKTPKGSGDSESDNGAAEPKGKAVTALGPTTSSKPSKGVVKKSSGNLTTTTKAKAAEPQTRSMTVETETVSSVPQASLNVGGDRGANGKLDVNGGVRLKTSNEMMKPKKERKKNPRRPASINTGTISSKADIFEAKVASAVEEANSSDSDETFVYESNPPEHHVPRSARHHSRTPSATSLASQVEPYGGRSKSISKEALHSVAGKRSMKFANYNSNLDVEAGSQGAGGAGGRMVSTPRHHHISRYSRTPNHAGLFDNDSPFAPGSKALSPRLVSGKSRPNSPRYIGGRLIWSPRKAEASSYDAEEGVADDERVPLIGSVRVNRARHARRPNGNSRHLDYDEEDEEDERHTSYVSRHGACLFITCLFLALCVGAGSFIMALSRPLIDVSIKDIRNVLASEQELMFDLNIRATNPNIFMITVSELNMDVFAKSGFAGTSAEWREQQRDPLFREDDRLRSTGWWSAGPPHTADGVDEGNDPIDDPGSDPQTMVLGRIFEFDSPLIFEASPIRRQPMLSQGEIRLTQPGNKTEEGGSARWERVIQHRFELIVGGALKYQLPLSSRTRSASVRSKIMVNPKDAAGAPPHHPLEKP